MANVTAPPRVNGAHTRHIEDIPRADRAHDAQERADDAHASAHPRVEDAQETRAAHPARADAHAHCAPSRWGAVMTWALLILCACASVVANVAGAQPRFLAQVFAGAPPVVFLACVEVILRAQVPRLFRYQSARFVGLVIVAAVSAVASYIHQVDLLVSLGEHGLIAHTLPAALDGAMLLASVTLLGLAEKKRDYAHAEARRALEDAQRARESAHAPRIARADAQPDAQSAQGPRVMRAEDAQRAHADTRGAQDNARDARTSAHERAPRAPVRPSARAEDAAALVARAYAPGVSAPKIKEALARGGHQVALRTVQEHVKRIKESLPA